MPSVLDTRLPITLSRTGLSLVLSIILAPPTALQSFSPRTQSLFESSHIYILEFIYFLEEYAMAWRVVLIFLTTIVVLFEQAAASYHQPSGCEICATNDDCTHAYKGSPGQYCGSWHDVIASQQKPCCCPTNTYCKVSAYECRCHVPGPSTAGHGVPSSPYYKTEYPSYGSNDPYWFVRLILWILLLTCCCCCFAPCRKDRGKHSGGGNDDPFVTYPIISDWGAGTNGSYPESVPVPVPYANNPPAMNPAYTNNYYGSTSGNSGLAPALGGLAVGAAVGNMMGKRNANGYFGGGSGGYDIAGDSGGGGGYDIEGDS